MFVESWFWGEFFNVISSAGWVAVAYLAYTVPEDPTLGDIMRYWMSYGCLTMLSSTVMFVSNWLYFTGYRTDRVDELQHRPHSKRRSTCGFARELIFWAVWVDFIGGACYFAGSVWLTWDYMNLLTGLPFSPDEPSGTPSTVNSVALFDNMNMTVSNCTFDQLTPTALDDATSAWDLRFTQGDGISCRYFLFGDLSYTIDSILYIILWYREHRRAQQQSEPNPYASLRETPTLNFPGFDPIIYSDRIGIST